MAKSLRSQAKKRTRVVLRNEVFKPVEDLRLQRLAAAQAAAALGPSVGVSTEKSGEKDQSVTATEESNTMAVDHPKISISQRRKQKVAQKLRHKKGKKQSKRF